MRQPLPDVPGAIVSAAFQRRVHGALLDDSVVTTDAGIEVQLSVKVGARVTEKDPDFRDTIMLGWQAQAQGRWAGIVAPPDAEGMRALRQLVFLARENDNVAEFMTRTTTPRVVAHRPRFEAVRNILDAAAGVPISDTDFHAFLRKFALIGLDFDIPPHRDEDVVVAALEGNRGVTRNEARSLYSKLVEIGEELAIAAASVNYAGLQRRLRERHVVAGLSPGLRPLRWEIAQYADHTFESKKEMTAGVHLDRASLVADVETALAAGHDVIVTGAAGFGKSTVVRNFVAAMEASGPVLHLSGRRIENAGSWPALAAEIGIPADRARLAELLAAHPRGATVVVDSVEHIASTAARATTNDLLHALRAAGDPLNVVLGVRDTALGHVAWLETTELRPLRQVVVGPLNDEETVMIAAASPVLGELIARSRNPFPGGLKLLSLLHDDRIDNSALAQALATESDLLDLWWGTVLVGNTAAAHDRRRVTLISAEAVIAHPSGYFELPMAASGSVIESLITDGVLVHEPMLDRYRFGHDIVQDWAIVHWLLNGAGDQLGRLRRVLATPGYYRAVSLFAQRLAERDASRYDELRTAVVAFEDQRAAHAFVSALVLSPDATRLLEEHKDELLADNGGQLAALLRIVEVEQIHLNAEAVDTMRRAGSSAGEAIALAASVSPPRWRVWSPLIAFCVEHIDDIGSAFFPFLKIAKRWQQTTSSDVPHRRRILDVAIRVLMFLEGWRPHEVNEIGPRISRANQDAAEKLARAIVAFSADVDPVFVAQYLRDLINLGYGDDQDDMLEWLPAISRVFTDEVVDFGSRVLIAPDVPPWQLDMAHVGLEDHYAYFPASDRQGPFLGVLRTNEVAGLGLARALAQRAADKYASRMAARGAHQRPLWFMFAGRPTTFFGDGRTYAWFRPHAHDSSVLTSALMAVETWALEVIAAGRSPLEVLEVLLADGATLPFLGIAVGLAYDHQELMSALSDLAAQPWFWRLEDARTNLDAQPDDLSDVMPMEEQLPAFREGIVAHNRARDARRERFRWPPTFAADALFNPACIPQREAFLVRVAEMTLVDATWYEEEATLAAQDPSSEGVAGARAAFATFSHVTSPASYDVEGERVTLRPIPIDPQVQARAKTNLAVTAMHAGNLHANKLLRDYTPPDFPQAFDEGAQRIDNVAHTEGLTGDDLASARMAALRFACVAVTFVPHAGGVAPEASVRRVLDAARDYDPVRWYDDREDHDLMDIRVNVATALGALFAANPDNDELRSLVFRLATRSALLEVMRGLSRGVLPAWTSRPSAAATVLSLMMESALHVDTGSSVDDATVTAADGAERGGVARPWPVLAHLSRPSVFRIGKLLGSGLPRRIVAADAVAALVPLIEALLEASEAGGDDTAWFSFNGAVGRLAANVEVATGSGYDAYLRRLADWRRTPELFGEMMAGLARSHFGDAEIDVAASRFMSLALPFLRADHRATLAREYFSREFRDICWALIMIQEFEGLLVPEGWAYAERFAEHIDRWVAAVSGHPTNVEALLVFLQRFERAFMAARIVGWLDKAIASTASQRLGAVWSRSGLMIAALLLYLINERPAEMAVPATHAIAAALAERLLVEGVSGAGELRDALERIFRP